MNVVQTLIQVARIFQVFLGKIVQAQIVFPVWVLISFSVKFHSFVKKNASSTIEQRKCESHEKRDRLPFAKMAISYQIFQRNKVFTL